MFACLVRRFFGVAFVVLALVLVPQGASATTDLDQISHGPKVGDPLPHPLTVADQHKNIREFDALKRKRGLILLFSRSFDW